MAVIRPNIETDPAALVQIAHDYLRSVIPGWAPSDGDLMTWLIAAHAQMVAEERDVAADVPLEQILRPLGEKIHRIAPEAAAPAMVTATVTMRDRDGYTIPQGMEVLVKTSGDDGVTFVVSAAVTVPPGQIATREAAVELHAAPGREGVAGNGLTSDNAAVPIRSFDFIESVVLAGASSGGRDAETDEAYLERLVGELELTSPIPILPDDFARLARREDGVARALALDLYDPGEPNANPPVLPSTGNPRTVSVAVVDVDGRALGATAKNRARESLTAMREANWRCFVIDPTYTRVKVEFTAVTWPAFEVGPVEAAARAAVASYLSPARWGTTPAGVGADGGAASGWIDEPVLRYLEVAQVLNDVPGLRYVRSLGIARENGTLGTSDVPLDGPAALPHWEPSIRGTVEKG